MIDSNKEIFLTDQEIIDLATNKKDRQINSLINGFVYEYNGGVFPSFVEDVCIRKHILEFAKEVIKKNQEKKDSLDQ